MEQFVLDTKIVEVDGLGPVIQVNDLRKCLRLLKFNVGIEHEESEYMSDLDFNRIVDERFGRGLV